MGFAWTAGKCVVVRNGNFQSLGIVEMAATTKGVVVFGRRGLMILFAGVSLYLALGLTFHLAWVNSHRDCRTSGRTHADFLDPSATKDVLGWPVVAGSNSLTRDNLLYTPCDYDDW